MKNRALLLLAASLVVLAACKDNNNPSQRNNFTLTFRALYDGQSLEKGKNYPYDSKVILFDKFNTYLSDITLLKGAEETRLSDIEWVDFTPDLAPDNKAVDVTIKFTVPDGDYTGLKIGYGVRADLNAKKPSDYPVGHPLYLENEYWNGWSSYIFTKVQGRYDLNGDNVPEANLFYHCGSMPCTIRRHLRKTSPFPEMLLLLSFLTSKNSSRSTASCSISPIRPIRPHRTMPAILHLAKRSCSISKRHHPAIVSSFHPMVRTTDGQNRLK